VNRVFVSFPVVDFHQTRIQLLHWAQQFASCCFLDNHEYPSAYHLHECLLGAGSLAQVEAKAGSAFESLNRFSARHPDWLFGHFGYDLKNETENLSSVKKDFVGFSDLCFFVPEFVVELSASVLRIGSLHEDHHHAAKEILRVPGKSASETKKVHQPVGRISKSEYLSTVEKLRLHILKGDCYEINFCQEFYGEELLSDPVSTYFSLGQASPMPFACFYKNKSSYLLCASPERYLKRSANRVLSQPIKGTWTRDLKDPALDRDNKNKLFWSSKDRSENVMAVDLVRNDLSKICLPGSVCVEELYGIYSFPQVHQMISTISGQLMEGISWTEIIKATFPMASMTGAPKRKVLELIEQYERSRRGLFSGAIGYVTPDKDFDFNVVIRSILYNDRDRYLSYQVGSGITFYSDAAAEYEECMLKASAIKKVLTF
jgi:para-aminobenzoate synthetase component I